MARRCFDHLAAEISVALGRPVPRYRLWLHLHGMGLDPERLSSRQAAHFCGAPLTRFLGDCGLRMGPRVQRRLQRAMGRFDPALPTPAERFAGL